MTLTEMRMSPTVFEVSDSSRVTENTVIHYLWSQKKSTYRITRESCLSSFSLPYIPKDCNLRMIHELLSSSRNFSMHMAQHSTNNLGDSAGVNLLYFFYAVNRWHEVSYTISKCKDQSFEHCVHFVQLCLKLGDLQSLTVKLQFCA
jgi:hypothetical protein